MANYGQLLVDFEPEKESIYKHMVEYFNHPVLHKIKDVETFSVYMAKLYCLLSNECRYIVVFVEKDVNPPGSQKQLDNMFWVSFQTRTMADNHDIPPHSYEPRMYEPLNVLLKRTEVLPGNSIYDCDKYSISVTLLHEDETITNSYQDIGTIVGALETFQTIITFK